MNCKGLSTGGAERLIRARRIEAAGAGPWPSAALKWLTKSTAPVWIVGIPAPAASGASRPSAEWLATAAAGSLFSSSSPASLDAHLRRGEYPLVVLVVIVVETERSCFALAHDTKDSTWRLTGGDRIRLHAAP
jgi:hypothetical protein